LLKVDITSLGVPPTARIFVSANSAYTDSQILLPRFLSPFPNGLTIKQNRSDASASMEFWINAAQFFIMKTLVWRIGFFILLTYLLIIPAHCKNRHRLAIRKFAHENELFCRR
jgi:hypothetical protein